MTQTTSNAAMSRRGWFRSAGLLAGGAMLGGTLLRTTSAGAQDAAAGTTGTGGMMTGGGMPNGTGLMMTAAGGPVPGLGFAAKDKLKPGKVANDLAILNVALTLEYLESEFYSRVVAADEAQPYLSGRVKDFARVLARDEAAHVVVVTQMIQELGGTPVAKPGFQFPANVFISPVAFLDLSSALEETGVGAYLGAAPMLQNKHVLDFAASIYGIEARHAGVIKYLRGDAMAPRELEMPLTIEQALARANPYIIKDQVNVTGTP